MKLNINKLGFEIEPVPGTLRPSIVADEAVRQSSLREVYAWDAKTGEGRFLTRTLGKDGVPLANGITFFVPRATPEGTVVNNAAPARKMQDRFLAATGVKDTGALLRVLSRVIPLPRIPVPLSLFEPLNAVASYRLRLATDTSVVRLREAGRNLSAYLHIPGQVSFQCEVTEIVDEAGYARVLEAEPRLGTMQPHYVVPAGSQAGHDIRRMAVSRRIEEHRPAIEAAREKGETPPADMAMDFARLVREWQALNQPRKPLPVQPGARRAPA